ncbi:hypothetical protein [Staphylococcus caeli]|uniref:Uncharacterized protein n=1 Tax=Staphylococcus caeli TaxID=2201815 RepID=A0A1D4Q5K4_9STAP|nr:hypothetical protein [Staphylococcus caeli]SCS28036.1 Uncharacterised protein [Staphylococcus caeli]SCT30488.1 Uncharacterised protein [Staphylococcus caeli]
MGTILLIGLLIPVVYLMQLIKKKQEISMKQVTFTILLSIIGVVITTIIMLIFDQSKSGVWAYILSAFMVAIIWGLLLSACYYVYQVLSGSAKK